jgi:6-phosphogluconolactonase/glucosamine-6-phosphate isomerase/deaminase
MRVLVGKDENAWVDLAWTWIHENTVPGQRVFMPAGGTPTALYRRMSAQPSDLLKTLTFVQLDEVISGPKQGLFRQYFEAELPLFKRQFEWIAAADRTADVAILGVGLNGHVAFHEPHLPKGFSSGCVRLTDETLKVLELKDPTWGLTYGVGTFLQAKKILVLARGEAKRKVLNHALAIKELPISWMLAHGDVTVISDLPLDAPTLRSKAG